MERKNGEHPETEQKERDRIIIRTSAVGIAVNLLLAGFKAGVGLLSHSIAVVLDAVNNLSDALSSVITITGTKLAGKAPDKKHPLGYGRIEYLSAMIVALIVLYAGVTALAESVKKILHPEQANYSITSLIIIGAAILGKLLLGRYVKKQGEKVKSQALVASGADALFDAVLSASVLVSAIVYMVCRISLEAYVGVIIAAIIIKSGFEMLWETLGEILGQRPDPEITERIKQILTEEKEVMGAYDLILNNYGPNKNYASVHLELPDKMQVEQVDVLTRKLQEQVYVQTGVILTGVGVYSYNTQENESSRIRNKVQNIVLSHDWVLQLHGFYMDLKEKDMRFDVVLSFDIRQQEGIEILEEELRTEYPAYTIRITADVDTSDI